MMAQPFSQITSLALPLLRDNVDTDQIIPSREMKSTGKTGLASGLFAGWRYIGTSGRDPDPAFILNDPRHAQSRVILTGRNFGCGSSREHAVWALAEYGVRAILAESFAPIFAGNCVRNGIVPIVLEPDAIAAIAASDAPVSIRLDEQDVTGADGSRWTFEIDAEAKAMLRDGLDAIDFTLRQAGDIAAWQDRDRAARPWIYLENPA